MMKPGGSNTFTTLSRHTLIYSAGFLLNGILGFVLLPIFTRFLLPEEYGVYALLEIALQFLITVYGFGFNISVLKFYSAAEGTQAKTALINNVLIFSLASAFFLSLGIVTLAGPISRRVFVGVPEPFIVYTALILFFESIWALFLTIFRANQKPGKFVVASVLQVGFGLLAIILFVVGLQEKALGILKGRLVGDVLVCGVLLWEHRKQFGFDFSWRRIRSLLAYGLPMLPAGLAITWINLSGRYFLNHYSTLTEVGIFAIAQKLSGSVNLLLIQPFGTAWLPIMFDLEKRHDAPNLFARFTTYYVLCGGFSFLILTLFVPEIFLIFTSKPYQGGMEVYPTLVLAFLVYGLIYPFSIGILLKTLNWVMPYIYGAGVIINFLLNTVLVKSYGAWGAALAFLLTFCVVSACLGILSQRFYPIPFEVGRLATVIGVTVILFWIGNLFMSEGLRNLAVRAGLVVSFPIVLYGLGFLNDAERAKAFALSQQVRVRGATLARALLKRNEP